MSDHPPATFHIYAPPSPGLPYLAVMIDDKGEVAAAPYRTAGDAKDHNNQYSKELDERLRELRSKRPDETQER